MGEVAAVVEAQAEDGVAGLEQRLVHAHVGVGAGVRLDVGVLGAEQRLGPLDGQRLDVVDDGVAAVVALARVALGVLVGQHRPDGAQHGRRREVLAGDQLQAGRLALELAGEQGLDLGVGFGVGGERHRRLLDQNWALEVGDLGDATGVAAAFELGGEERVQDLLGEPDADDAGADRQHVGVVVGPRQARRVEVVAQRGAHAADLVGGQLLALPAAADHDARPRRAPSRTVRPTAAQIGG